MPRRAHLPVIQQIEIVLIGRFVIGGGVKDPVERSPQFRQLRVEFFCALRIGGDFLFEAAQDRRHITGRRRPPSRRSPLGPPNRSVGSRRQLETVLTKSMAALPPIMSASVQS